MTQNMPELQPLKHWQEIQDQAVKCKTVGLPVICHRHFSKPVLEKMQAAKSLEFAPTGKRPQATGMRHTHTAQSKCFSTQATQGQKQAAVFKQMAVSIQAKEGTQSFNKQEEKL